MAPISATKPRVRLRNADSDQLIDDQGKAQLLVYHLCTKLSQLNVSDIDTTAGRNEVQLSIMTFRPIGTNLFQKSILD